MEMILQILSTTYHMQNQQVCLSSLSDFCTIVQIMHVLDNKENTELPSENNKNW